eukprot:9300978-Pyramimonas_sp.AAC.1
MPAGVHGHQVHGVFGAQLTQCRRGLAQSRASPAKGRCLATALDLRAPDADPAVWWSQPKEIRSGVREVWGSIVGKFQQMTGAQQCRAIRGPVPTVIHSLLRLGWTPLEASTWCYQAGPDRVGEWQFPDSAYGQTKVVLQTDLLAHIKEAAELKVWSAASHHYCGGGVESGVGNTSFRKLLRQISCLEN